MRLQLESCVLHMKDTDNLERVQAMRGLECLISCAVNSLVGGCSEDGSQTLLGPAQQEDERQTATNFSRGNWNRL